MQQAFTKYIPINLQCIQHRISSRIGKVVPLVLNTDWTYNHTCNSWIAFLVLNVSWCEIPNLCLKPGFPFWILARSFGEKSGTQFKLLSVLEVICVLLWEWGLGWMRSGNETSVRGGAGWGLGMRPVSGKGLDEVWEWDQYQGRGCNTFVIHKFHFCWWRNVYLNTSIKLWENN